MYSRTYIRSTTEAVSFIKRNFTEINENYTQYEGAADSNDDEADYSAAISVKAVRIA
ncbi:hypothetical protein [Cohnella silvisoli]|uniref:Uncharacterized protein n=1 Tax=Cohnella silvisoli TaxID=2873699 RepID=A0ABV1L065_9BACL|nr:hypothetical protein [Cohnella silvisoli]MCD9024362.1 hypothetical protein [Cohnella silvisoli]